jgi:hypothetical protein
MYFKKPVLTVIHKFFIGYEETLNTEFGTREAVMDLVDAKEWIRLYRSSTKKIAYKFWLDTYKRLQPCIVCDERDPDKLSLHHLGEEYTRRQKKDRIANMVSNQLPLHEIEHEMIKCAMVCFNCHQKYHKAGKQGLDDLYDLSERVYGIYYGPGADVEETKHLRRKFRKELNNVDIELVDENRSKTDQEQDERIAVSIYQAGRHKCQDEDVMYLYSKLWTERPTLHVNFKR